MSLLQYSKNLARPSDIQFIYNSWLKSLRTYGKNNINPIYKNIRKSTYFKYQHDKIESIIENCKVLIARSNNDEDQIYGWIAYDLNASVHYVYVKNAYRRMGVATDLLNTTVPDFKKATFFYTHRTPLMGFLEQRWNCEYNPYLSEVYSGTILF